MRSSVTCSFLGTRPPDLCPVGRAILQHQPVAVAQPVLLVLPDGTGQAAASGGCHLAPLRHAPRCRRGVPGEATGGRSRRRGRGCGLIGDMHDAGARFFLPRSSHHD